MLVMAWECTVTRNVTLLDLFISCDEHILRLLTFHCRGGGMSGPSGSISDLRKLLPLISFVVATKNSTRAATSQEFGDCNLILLLLDYTIILSSLILESHYRGHLYPLNYDHHFQELLALQLLLLIYLLLAYENRWHQN